ncbi:hypothetical protein [Streptomyces sp. NPDC053048]|uniref:hypothetical protein n=1 Tax=Streptomyces sp. NPDC053048 TaxID=3365694 RepID=UPI0037D93681
MMYALLYALNEAQERVIDHASDVLEDMSDEIASATDAAAAGDRDPQRRGAALQGLGQPGADGRPLGEGLPAEG